MRQFAAVLAVSIVLLGVGLTHASITTIRVQAGDSVKMSPGSHQYAMHGETGGEFGMTVWDSAGTLKGTFYTFCADPTTFINYNTRYVVHAVADSNALGYQLSNYGKWIYYQFAKNDSGPVTASYIPGHTTTTSDPNVAEGAIFTDLVAGAIQEGLWQELTKNNVVDWPAGWTHAAYDKVSADQNWLSNYQNGANDDFLLDMGAVNIGQLQLNQVGVQNQMVLTFVGGAPNEVTPVPEPATVIVWSVLGLAAAGFGAWRRKRPG